MKSVSGMQRARLESVEERMAVTNGSQSDGTNREGRAACTLLCGILHGTAKKSLVYIVMTWEGLTD